MAQIFQVPADFGGHLGFMQMRSIKCTNHVCPDLKSFSMLRSMFVPNFMLLPQFAVFWVLTAPLPWCTDHKTLGAPGRQNRRPVTLQILYIFTQVKFWHSLFWSCRFLTRPQCSPPITTVRLHHDRNTVHHHDLMSASRPQRSPPSRP